MAREVQAQETVKIVIPLPPPFLSPNRPCGSRGGRILRSRLTKKYREIARRAASIAGVESGPWEKATIKADFYHKTQRRRDDVNQLAMLKPAYDGIVDAGIMVDDDSTHLFTLTPAFHLDKKCPRVELTLTRTE